MRKYHPKDFLAKVELVIGMWTVNTETFAPGRVELLGNHTDYNLGVVLSAAIDLGVTVRGERLDNRIVLASESEGEEFELRLSSSEVSPRGSWVDYPLGVFQVLRNSGYPVAGFRAVFRSNLPVGAGLSSSAAIEVGTALLLCGLYGFSPAPMELAKLCRRAENEFVGVNCGLLDQVSSIFGRQDHVIFLDCRSEAVDLISMPAGLALLVVHSGVGHKLTGGEYNDRRAACFEAARRMGLGSLREASSAMVEQAKLPEELRRRALHITGENERVMRAVEALRGGRVREMGELMTISHQSSRENFENSTQELDVLVEIALSQEGVYGARLTGGGFGGAIVALVEDSKMRLVAEEIVKEYRERTGHAGRVIACHLGGGARIFWDGKFPDRDK